jgi:hypothetical protein
MVEGEGSVSRRSHLIAVHAAPAASHDLRLDALRLAPLPLLRATALRQKISFRPTAQIAVVILPERLRARAVMPVEVADPAKRYRPPGLHRLVFRDQETPLLQIVPLIVRS